MKTTYHDVHVMAALAALETDLPAIVAEHGHSAAFWQAFCERVSAIEDASGPDGWIHVNRQVDWMLERLRIDPGGWNGFFDA